MVGGSPAGLQAWEALGELQSGKAPPTPGVANSSFKRCSLDDPLVFKSDAGWELELSKMTGAIIGLRFRGTVAAAAGTAATKAAVATTTAAKGSRRWALLRWLQQLPALSGLWGRCTAAVPDAHNAAALSDNWAAPDAPLALPVYSTYSGAPRHQPTWEAGACLVILDV